VSQPHLAELPHHVPTSFRRVLRVHSYHCCRRVTQACTTNQRSRPKMQHVHVSPTLNTLLAYANGPPTGAYTGGCVPIPATPPPLGIERRPTNLTSRDDLFRACESTPFSCVALRRTLVDVRGVLLQSNPIPSCCRYQGARNCSLAVFFPLHGVQHTAFPPSAGYYSWPWASFVPPLTGRASFSGGAGHSSPYLSILLTTRSPRTGGLGDVKGQKVQILVKVNERMTV
jgi:hypothetical protein